MSTPRNLPIRYRRPLRPTLTAFRSAFYTRLFTSSATTLAVAYALDGT